MLEAPKVSESSATAHLVKVTMEVSEKAPSMVEVTVEVSESTALAVQHQRTKAHVALLAELAWRLLLRYDIL